MPNLNPEGDKPAYDPRFPPGLGSWRKIADEQDQPEPSGISQAKATESSPTNLSEKFRLVRKYPDVSITHEIELRTLEKLLDRQYDPDTSWTETVTILEHTGLWGQQMWRNRDIERNLETDYREKLRIKVVAKLYDGLSGDPLAEELARQIIAKNPLQPVT